MKPVLLCVLAVACAAWMVTSAAHTQAEEREFKSTIPAHVPVKVKVKNEQRFKDLRNKEWARELEIEVKNTGSKPIYYLFGILNMPDFVFDDGVPLGIRIAYGRQQLGLIETPLEPEDVPILPGETITLKIRESQVRGYEHLRDQKGRDSKKIEFDMQIINFGDGTGLRGKDGRPYLPKKQTSEAGRPRAGAGGCEPRPTARGDDASINLLKEFDATTPASFLRANFFPAPRKSSAAPPAPARDLCNCQNSSDCAWMKIACPSCPCDGLCPFIGVLPAGGCADPQGECLRIQTRRDSCVTEFNGTQVCTYDEDIGGCSITNPTPTPTPTPTPSLPPPPCPGAVREIAGLECPPGYHPAGFGYCCPDFFAGNCDSQAQNECLQIWGWSFNSTNCSCYCDNICMETPVLIDTGGDGLSLTGASAGVRFDLDRDGVKERLAWTRPGSDDAWLALDRDGDGTVEDGSELFGSRTEQAPSPRPNGFSALAEFDRAARGGNSDGVIDARDAVFLNLRLWRDANHDGLSQAWELSTLPAAGVGALHLDYKESKRVDEHGNRFRYRAKVDDARGASVSRWAWDVFLVAER